MAEALGEINQIQGNDNMKPEAKLNLIVLGYCVFLWLSNWSLSHTYYRKGGVVASSIDFRPVGLLLGVIASYILARRIWRVVRSYLDRGIRIRSEMRIWGGWTMLLLLMPLCFGYSSQSNGFADDGVPMTTIFEYGGTISLYSAVFSGFVIMLFLALVRLESFNPE